MPRPASVRPRGSGKGEEDLGQPLAGHRKFHLSPTHQPHGMAEVMFFYSQGSNILGKMYLRSEK